MKSNTSKNDSTVQFVTDPDGLALDLVVTDRAVLDGARTWAGQQAAAEPTDDDPGVDLQPYVEQVLHIGASVLAAAGTSADVAAARAALTAAAERTERAVADATARSTAAAAETVEQFEKLRADSTVATGTLVEQVTRQLDSSTRTTIETIEKLFGGSENPLVALASTAITKATTEIQDNLERRLRETVTSVESKFDVGDPGSPIGKLAATLKANQDEIRTAHREGERELGGKVDAIGIRLAEATAAKTAANKTASVTPIKGSSYEDAVHTVLEQVTAAMGDGYTRTGHTVGAIARCKKGDGLITVLDVGGRSDVTAHVAVEAHNGDSGARNWQDWDSYLDETLRNRKADTVLGVVRTAAQLPGGEVLRLLGSKRMVVAFDPETDDQALLRAAILLLRTQACLVASRSSGDRLDEAREALAAATAQLAQLAAAQKTAGSIKAGADTIVSKLGTVHDALSRHLLAAGDALRQAAADAGADVDSGSGTAGAEVATGGDETGETGVAA